jgi:rSAM/selenodomain-associated transferase 1
MNRANRFNAKFSTDKSASFSAALNGVSRPRRRANPPSCGIAFMAKASVPGRAKTRLVPPLSFEEAAALNTAFLRDVADNVLLAARHLACDGDELAPSRAGIAGYAAYGPPGSEEFFRRTLPLSIALISAWLPNFGDCLFQTISEILSRRHSAAVVLNADSPTLPTAFLIKTAELLAQPGDRAVLGPSSDGGYYLLGLKAAHRRMFEGITWSSAMVAEQTRQRAREIGLDLHTLPTWYDVDDVEDLGRLYAELCAEAVASPRLSSHPPHYAVQTAKLMSALSRNHAFDSRINKIPQAAGAGA